MAKGKRCAPKRRKRHVGGVLAAVLALALIAGAAAFVLPRVLAGGEGQENADAAVENLDGNG